MPSTMMLSRLLSSPSSLSSLSPFRSLSSSASSTKTLAAAVANAAAAAAASSAAPAVSTAGATTQRLAVSRRPMLITRRGMSYCSSPSSPLSFPSPPSPLLTRPSQGESAGLMLLLRPVYVVVPSKRPLISPVTRRWHSSTNNSNNNNNDAGGEDRDTTPETVHISFLQPDDTIKTVEARVGESFLQLAHRHDVDLEGACEGVCACSTCHLIFPKHVFDMLPEPSEDEEDMLDMAFGLTEFSRLGCQVSVTHNMDKIQVEMPKATRNFYVDGHVPKPH